MTHPSALQVKDWSKLPARTALAGQTLQDALAQHAGWRVVGSDTQQAIEKTFRFANYFQTMAFVNALAWVAHQQDHHPSLQVEYGQCTVRWNTHDAGGLTATDFDCAQRTDTLVSTS